MDVIRAFSGAEKPFLFSDLAALTSEKARIYMDCEVLPKGFYYYMKEFASTSEVIFQEFTFMCG